MKKTVYPELGTAVIFKKCLGINDIRSFASQETNEETGETQLLSALNVTTSADGAMERIPELTTILSHTDAITDLSASKRFFLQDAANTYEWDGTTKTLPFTIINGPIIHTPIDVRVSDAATNYKSLDSDPLNPTACLVGTNPNPEISTRFAAMPLYDGGFLHNAKVYIVNRTDNRFLQYCEDYSYDLFNLGDGFIPFKYPILQAGGATTENKEMTGCIVATHENGVTVLAGTSPADFKQRYFQCDVIDGTLYSGFVSKLLGYGHIFLCNDGVYFINSDGEVKNLTINTTNYLNDLNTSYVGAVVHDGKYLAVGDNVTLEYDFVTQSVLHRSSFSATGITSWEGDVYYSVGTDLMKLSSTIDTSTTLTTSVAFPYSYLGAQGGKTFLDLFFTGYIGGVVNITATDDLGNSWTITKTALGQCANKRIKTPMKPLGSHISFSIECTSGEFRMEELKASFSASKRVR